MARGRWQRNGQSSKKGPGDRTPFILRQAQDSVLATGAHDKVPPEIEIVGEAADGREAVRLVEECRPDVVLMDARMPRMDGLEATRLIKDRWPELKVIVLTMYASYRADALAAGADAFLVKGCPAEELLEAVLDR